MIKTIIPSEQLPYALEKHQRWVDEHADLEALQAHRRAHLEELESLQAEHAELARRWRLAKAADRRKAARR
jgi:hypothetical protein